MSRGNRKSCTNCKAKLEPGANLFSWGEYKYAKFRHIKDVCKACWPELAKRLQEHKGDCGCEFELVACGASKPEWMKLEETCPTSPSSAPSSPPTAP